MGTWGPGNFDDDAAADHLARLTDQLATEVAEAMAGDPVGVEPDEYWGVAVPANLELLAVLARLDYVGVLLPEVATIEAWKAKFLEIWDGSIDGLEPSPAFKEARRAVLVRTFEDLIELRKTADAG
ncbi:hypothetical protein GCM10010413_06470 [Promicromonospora sukumoe]|uniref:DUF4259 domain-containing protein n=1 Tax=Promicromonospora sukumoe TaxID=88382 RepID=A0A7W3J4V6_9MICO|nr:DUF4259 domain-containing protein [Promicromonospora sukumoe]MBA8806239.1 hypothetical protein [Promicromonospora sukumoe]